MLVDDDREAGQLLRRDLLRAVPWIRNETRDALVRFCLLRPPNDGPHEDGVRAVRVDREPHASTTSKPTSSSMGWKGCVSQGPASGFPQGFAISENSRAP